MALGRLVLRATVGGLIVGHGLQKLKGSFGGPGLEGTEQMMGSIGLHPAKHQAWAAALTETIGGGLTVAGFLTPLGSAMIIGSQAVAIEKVHFKNGVWISSGGYEYNVTIIAAALALALEGAGPVSLDGLFRRQRSGVGWGLVSLILGLGGAAVTSSVSDRFKPDESDAAASAASTTDAAQA